MGRPRPSDDPDGRGSNQMPDRLSDTSSPAPAGDTPPSSTTGESPLMQDGQTVARSAEILLREHPDAQVCGLASNGLIVPVPQSVGLWGQGLIEGRALIDNVVADDRTVVVRTWLAANEHGAAVARVRMLNRPTSWARLHFIDLREVHGVLLGVVVPSDETADADAPAPEERLAAPRFCTLTEDEGAKVLAADAAFTQMFGYSEEEILGKSVLDQIHPDDQGRAIEGWLAVLATRRAQQTRLRRKRKDGGWTWVDTTLHNYLGDPERRCVMVELIDISAEMQAQEALHEREELLRRLTDAMPVGLLQIDNSRGIVYHNARLLDILYGAEEIELPAPRERIDEASEAEPTTPAASLLKTLSDESLAAFEATLDEVLGEGTDGDLEVDIKLPSGASRRALLSVRALHRATGEVSGAITCVLDMTDSARARQELERRATFDTLTQVHNRSSILSTLQHELERHDVAQTGVVYVDLDKFKPVNDELGHAAGDELLVLVADRLKVASRDSDLVGRLGGDEFLIVLRDLPGPEIAMQVADRIGMALCGSFELTGGTAEVRVSIGVACVESGLLDAEDLVKQADAAMYSSKRVGECRPVLAPTL